MFFMDFTKIKLVLFRATVVGRYNDISEEQKITKQGELFFSLWAIAKLPSQARILMWVNGG